MLWPMGIIALVIWFIYKCSVYVEGTEKIKDDINYSIENELKRTPGDKTDRIEAILRTTGVWSKYGAANSGSNYIVQSENYPDYKVVEYVLRKYPTETRLALKRCNMEYDSMTRHIYLNNGGSRIVLKPDGRLYKA